MFVDEEALCAERIEDPFLLSRLDKLLDQWNEIDQSHYLTVVPLHGETLRLDADRP